MKESLLALALSALMLAACGGDNDRGRDNDHNGTRFEQSDRNDDGNHDRNDYRDDDRDDDDRR
ncbi:hypothetical protein EGK75_11675 [Neisseria weixii]|uniref:Uncharacterized protein n=1 Tax=Neisseria weixii TaxID=1853276 RepID=A0A3N4MJX8_9NEIS|nr:hypothetical protein [Neisseria weixii]RPD83994.1 hypothetical protein EGK74_11515 [Neisseria weixii]RPD84734.1 hypothetical protein EGK75_11675 [Neisseria weixii]